MTDNTKQRKADHIRICLEEDVQFQASNGLEKYRFTHTCLPELNYQDLDITTNFLGKNLTTPLLISSMTGGTEYAQTINQRLATVAQAYGLAMGVGSQRVAIEQADTAPTFQVRAVAPNILLLANLGAVQLNNGYGWEQCQQAVDLLQADALILHINPLQECIQPQGDTNFQGLLAKIELVCRHVSVPVIAKEVGNGISIQMAQQLINAGVKAIDVAGAGGTSWSLVESQRAPAALQQKLGQTFANWGIPTAECLTQIDSAYPNIPLIASGGLRDGLDMAKAMSLGADLVGMAWPFLRAAAISEEAVFDQVELLLAELKTAMFCTGSARLSELRQPGILTKI
jgi:isopentenyl-diphosphate Delta-isomerase